MGCTGCGAGCDTGAAGGANIAAVVLPEFVVLNELNVFCATIDGLCIGGGGAGTAEGGIGMSGGADWAGVTARAAVPPTCAPPG